MIRRDYILRMLEEFFELLSRMRALQKGQNWREAAQLAEAEFTKLVGVGAQTVVRMTETELLAALIKGEPTQAVREKTLMLATLLKESGDVAYGEDHRDIGDSYYLKGLNLLLGVLAREQVSDCPAFVPRIEGFLSGLGDSALPLSTQAMLMQHYERSGEFAKAEDALFVMLEEQPENLDLITFGIAFYKRLEHQSEAALCAGNLPRSEIQAGLAHLAERESILGQKWMSSHASVHLPVNHAS